jgi:hypothetical protein
MSLEEPEKAVLVAAGNYKEFILWCRINAINPHENPARAMYISSWTNIQGRRGYPYVVTGTFWDRQDANSIADTLGNIEAVRATKWKET